MSSVAPVSCREDCQHCKDIVSLGRRIEALEKPTGVRITIDFNGPQWDLKMQTQRDPIPRHAGCGNFDNESGGYIGTGEGRQFIVIATDPLAAREVLDRYFPKP